MFKMYSLNIIVHIVDLNFTAGIAFSLILNSIPFNNPLVFIIDLVIEMGQHIV